MFCQVCGCSLQEGSVFCPNCGSAAGSGSGDNPDMNDAAVNVPEASMQEGQAYYAPDGIPTQAAVGTQVLEREADPAAGAYGGWYSNEPPAANNAQAAQQACKSAADTSTAGQKNAPAAASSISGPAGSSRGPLPFLSSPPWRD
jgi:hypothetical protein